jgi:hypothetical protein
MPSMDALGGPRRGVSPLVVFTAALAAMTGAAALLLVRGSARRAAAPAVTTQTSTPSSPAADRRPGHRRANALPVPKLVAPESSPEPVENQGMWEAVNDLSQEERQRLAAFSATVFKDAAAAVALTPTELSRVKAVWQESEQRGHDLEQWAAAHPGEDGPGGPILELRALAVDELRALTDEIGETRARGFRKAERDDYRRVALRDRTESSLSTAMRTVLQRRMVALRWPPPAPGSVQTSANPAGGAAENPPEGALP